MRQTRTTTDDAVVKSSDSIFERLKGYDISELRSLLLDKVTSLKVVESDDSGINVLTVKLEISRIKASVHQAIHLMRIKGMELP